MHRPFLLLMLVVLHASLANAKVTMPAVFSDHMVLQRGAQAPVWGWAEPGESVKVSVAGQMKAAVAGDDGKWMVRFSNLKSDSPTSMKITASNSITINDVLIGEVWLGSGQSNMAMTVSRCRDFESEKAKANLPNIRMYTERSGSSKTASDRSNGKWVVCEPSSVGSFSGTLFFFGRQIHQKLDVPVGLINSSVGGTPIESWIDADAQMATSELTPMIQQLMKRLPDDQLKREAEQYQRSLEKWKAAVKSAKDAGKKTPRKPRNPAETRERKRNIGGLFNGKISPLIPFGIRGAIWYQGEANSTPDKARFYQYQLPLLITDWRKRWGYEFPFAWAQLPNYIGNGRDWPTVRQGMLDALKVPNTGMGINIDIGDPRDIHPKNKQDVGLRLSYWALGTVYDQEVPAISGPVPSGHRIEDDAVVIDFKFAEGLKTSDDTPPIGFEVQAADGQWHPAMANIVKQSVHVRNSKVTAPQAARYAWSNDPKCNLVNAAGLPASPMTTANE